MKILDNGIFIDAEQKNFDMTKMKIDGTIQTPQGDKTIVSIVTFMDVLYVSIK